MSAFETNVHYSHLLFPSRFEKKNLYIITTWFFVWSFLNVPNKQSTYYTCKQRNVFVFT